MYSVPAAFFVWLELWTDCIEMRLQAWHAFSKSALQSNSCFSLKKYFNDRSIFKQKYVQVSSGLSSF